MKQLAELLDIDVHSARKGKMIIFLQFATMLDLVQQFLDALSLPDVSTSESCDLPCDR